MSCHTQKSSWIQHNPCYHIWVTFIRFLLTFMGSPEAPIAPEFRSARCLRHLIDISLRHVEWHHSTGVVMIFNNGDMNDTKQGVQAQLQGHRHPSILHDRKVGQQHSLTHSFTEEAFLHAFPGILTHWRLFAYSVLTCVSSLIDTTNSLIYLPRCVHRLFVV